MNYILEFEGLIEKNGKKVPFHLKIGEPIKGENDEYAYFCSVYAPYLFKNIKNIFGIDKEQAVELSKNFVSVLIDGKMVYDKDGYPVKLF